MLKTIVTSISLSPERTERLATLAAQLGVSRNEAVNRLIEAAQVIHRPSINVLVTNDMNGESTGCMAPHRLEDIAKHT